MDDLDKKTIKMYNNVRKESLDLENAIKKDKTDSRIKLESIYYMTNEMFTKVRLSSESDNEKNRVLENTKKSEKKHVERIGYKRGVSSETEKEEEEEIEIQYKPPRYYKKHGGGGLRIMTPNQLLTRFPILLAQKKAGNNS